MSQKSIAGVHSHFAAPSQECSVLPPRRGTHKPAQGHAGNALGIESACLASSERAAHSEAQLCFALSGLRPLGLKNLGRRSRWSLCPRLVCGCPFGAESQAIRRTMPETESQSASRTPSDVLAVSIEAENDATRPPHWRSRATASGTLQSSIRRAEPPSTVPPRRLTTMNRPVIAPPGDFASLKDYPENRCVPRFRSIAGSLGIISVEVSAGDHPSRFAVSREGTACFKMRSLL